MIIYFLLYQAPTIENLVFLSDSSFDVESLVKMENTVLKMLDFNISVFTSYHFASRIALAAKMTEKEQTFMFYLLGDNNVSHISSIYLSTYLGCLSFNLSTCLIIFQFIYMPIYLSIYLYAYLSFNLSVCLFIFQFICMPIYLSIDLVLLIRMILNVAFRNFYYISSTGIELYIILKKNYFELICLIIIIIISIAINPIIIIVFFFSI